MSEQKKHQPSPPNQSINSHEPQTGNRRRGKVLEEAILQAAWDELSTVGYNHLTMEGVAARAKTNKAVIYRRWANKATLVIASLEKHLVKPSEEIPDTGDLRKDLLTLLCRITNSLQAVGSETVQGLMVDYFGKEVFASLPEKLHSGEEDKMSEAMITILKNAEKRGELNLQKISFRIISLPLDLLRYEILTTQKTFSDKTVYEIVDDIFIPLVTNSK